MACQHGIRANIAPVALPAGKKTFDLADIPFDEVLLSLHEGRFTGVLEVGKGAELDRIFLSEGSVVGLRPRPSVDRRLLVEAFSSLKLASAEAVAAAMDEAKDGLALGRQLVEAGLVEADHLDKAVEEQARRRLFALYEVEREDVRVKEGLDHLKNFHAVGVDVRPVISFGMVVRSSIDRKREMIDKVRGKTVRLVAPYDEQRNGYGLPPPVLLALRDLAEGVTFNGEIALPTLKPSETAGVLLLLDRMSLLKVS